MALLPGDRLLGVMGDSEEELTRSVLISIPYEGDPHFSVG
jgi:hypothetical protein